MKPHSYLICFCTFFLLVAFSNVISAQNPDLEQLLKNLPPGYQKMLLNESRPKGKLKFEALSSGNAFGFKAPGVNVSDPAISAAMKGGAVYAIEMGYCDDKPVAKYMYVLYLTKERRSSIFTVDQSRKKATLNLSGNMRVWAFDCGSKQYRETGSGGGGMQAEFITAIHQRPRFFQVQAGGGDVNDYMERVKETRKFYLQNLAKYYSDLAEIRKHPKISMITIPDYGPVGGGLPPAPPGISSEDSSILATGRAMGTAVNAMEWFHSLTGAESIAQKAAEFANEQIVSTLAPDASPEAVAEATAMAGMYNDLVGVVADPQGYLFDKAVNNMMKMVADVNKNFAQKGNGQAQAIERDARKEMRHGGNEYYAIDAEYMSGLLVKAFEQEIASLEKEKELEGNLPPSSAKGRIWGPGLSENIRAYAQAAGQPVAFSYAQSENQAAIDPAVLAALRKAGYPVPEQIPEPKYKDANVEIDATKPYFTGNLGSSTMVRYNEHASTPRLLVYFSVSSPEDTLASYFDPYGLTIFDLPFLNEEDPKEKCNYYVSVTGNDKGPGTSVAPFKTLQHALNKAKICRDEKKPVEIIVKNGVYRQSATVTWNDAPGASPLTIRGEEGTVFVSTEISNKQWQSNAGVWQTSMPLHPQQPAWNATAVIATNPPPVVVVNGQRLTYIPATKDLAAPATYMIAANKINAHPPADVTNINSATVEVGVRPYALKFSGARNVTVTNLVFRYFPQSSSNPTPGIIKTGSAQVSVAGCRFE